MRGSKFLEVAPWLGAVVAFLLHVLCIRVYPWNFAFDGYQRWAGRDQILVQGWLPVTQTVIWGVYQIGGQLTETRIALSLAACLGVWFAVRLAGHLGGPVAAGAMVVAGASGPFTVWTSTLYQEGTFLCLLFAGLCMAAEQRWLLADLLMGALGLTRYEGWPYVLAYLVWRRDPRALRVFWGIGLWLFLYGGLGFRGSQPSPINIDDWEGLTTRFHLRSWLGDLRVLLNMAVQSGTGAWTVLAAISAVLCRKRPEAGMIALLWGMLCIQGAMTAVWMVGLDEAIARMLVVPGMLAALAAVPGVAVLWEWPRLRWLGGIGALWLLGLGVAYTLEVMVDQTAEDTSLERAAMEKMAGCEGCTWWVEPRYGLGTRRRHDSCEMIQGLSTLQHGTDFWCARWIPEEKWAERKQSCNGLVRWIKPERGPGYYRVTWWPRGDLKGARNLDPSPVP